MIRRCLPAFLLPFVLLLPLTPPATGQTSALSGARQDAGEALAARLGEPQLRWLGERIFMNECGGRPRCLTAWNAGEDFPSLGIGHFIWYPSGRQGPFTESFPGLLAYMEARGATPPAWLDADQGAPWDHRQAFLDQLDSPRLQGLRDFLQDNLVLQTAYIVARFEQALPALLDHAPAARREILAQRFHAVAAAAPPHGLYALIDYVNFKGEGIEPRERYQGQGWGLLQVLDNMAGTDDPLEAFAASARETLSRRVRNAPAERNEARWLAGWHKRVDTYVPPDADGIAKDSQ